MRRDDIFAAIAADDGAGRRETFQAAEIRNEVELSGPGHHRAGHFQQALRRRFGVADMGGEKIRLDHVQRTQEMQGRIKGRNRALARPVLTAFDQQAGFSVRGVVERRVFDQPLADDMAGAADDMFGYGDGGGEADETPPRWLRGRLSDSDYPGDVGEAGLQGTVSVKFLVWTDGRVRRCEVTGSSGNATLDATTCRLIQQRFRYRPSLDAQGRPVPAWLIENHQWVIEGDGRR